MGKHSMKASTGKPSGKKPFKFDGAGSSSKGHGFALSRKRKFLKKYGKSIKRDIGKNPSIESLDTNTSDPHKRKSKSNELIAARKTFKEEQKVREQRKKETEEARKAHQEQVIKNIQKRKKTSSNLNKRTKRGQPVMKNQIMHMLDRIKNTS